MQVWTVVLAPPPPGRTGNLRGEGHSRKETTVIGTKLRRSRGLHALLLLRVVRVHGGVCGWRWSQCRRLIPVRSATKPGLQPKHCYKLLGGAAWIFQVQPVAVVYVVCRVGAGIAGSAEAKPRARGVDRNSKGGRQPCRQQALISTLEAPCETVCRTPVRAPRAPLPYEYRYCTAPAERTVARPVVVDGLLKHALQRAWMQDTRSGEDTGLRAWQQRRLGGVPARRRAVHG